MKQFKNPEKSAYTRICRSISQSNYPQVPEQGSFQGATDIVKIEVQASGELKIWCNDGTQVSLDARTFLEDQACRDNSAPRNLFKAESANWTNSKSDPVAESDEDAKNKAIRDCYSAAYVDCQIVQVYRKTKSFENGIYKSASVALALGNVKVDSQNVYSAASNNWWQAGQCPHDSARNQAIDNVKAVCLKLSKTPERCNTPEILHVMLVRQNWEDNKCTVNYDALLIP